MKNGQRQLQIAIEIILALLFCLTPLAFASAAPIYHPPIWIACSILLALDIALLRRRGLHRPVGRRKFTYHLPLLALWLFGLFLLMQLVMLLPIPRAVVAALVRYPVHGGFWSTIHPHVEIGFRSMMDWGSAFVVLFVMLTFPDSRAQIRHLAYVILGSAGFQAVYGIMEYAGGRQQILWYEKVAYLESATGTFVNRNHFADYLAMALCLAFGVFAYQYQKARNQVIRDGGLWERLLLLSFYLVVVLAGLTMSRSRGGLVAFFLGGTFFALFVSKVNRKLVAGGFVVLIVLVIIFSVWLGVDPAPSRFAEIHEDATTIDARPAVWKESLIIFSHAPVFGVGGGMFASAFSSLSSGNVLANYRYAHSDYLQTLTEFGTVGFLLLYGGIFLIFYQSLAAVTARKSKFAGYFTRGALSACVVFLAHSFLDFNMQIMANRILFFALLGMAYVTAQMRMTR